MCFSKQWNIQPILRPLMQNAVHFNIRNPQVFYLKICNSVRSYNPPIFSLIMKIQILCFRKAEDAVPFFEYSNNSIILKFGYLRSFSKIGSYGISPRRTRRSRRKVRIFRDSLFVPFVVRSDRLELYA